MRLYRVAYLYRITADTIMRGVEKKAKLTCEARNIAAALELGARLARRGCKILGDEAFVRVLAVKEAGKVTR